MKISLWIVESGISIKDIDPNFKWESNQIPLVGDNIDYSNSDGTLYFYGKVVSRSFTASTDEVSLDITVSDRVADEISNYLQKLRNTNE